MIVYGVIAYLGIAALTIGYFVAKRTGDSDPGRLTEEEGHETGNSV